jgi:hypothetical protein
MRKLKGPERGIEMVEIDLREAKTCRVQTQRPNRLRGGLRLKSDGDQNEQKALDKKKRSRESW